MTYKDEAKDHAARRVERVRRACGGEAEIERIADRAVTKGVHEHERHDHKGEKETALKLAGKSGKKRLDRVHRAHGGRAKAKPTEVNIIIDAAPQGSGPVAGAVPRPVPPVAAGPVPRPPMMPPHAPVGIPGAGMAPGIGVRPPIPAMPMRKRGGKVVDMDAGSGSGLGRLEKAAEYGART